MYFTIIWGLCSVYVYWSILYTGYDNSPFLPDFESSFHQFSLSMIYVRVDRWGSPQHDLWAIIVIYIFLYHHRANPIPGQTTVYPSLKLRCLMINLRLLNVHHVYMSLVINTLLKGKAIRGKSRDGES